VLQRWSPVGRPAAVARTTLAPTLRSLSKNGAYYGSNGRVFESSRVRTRRLEPGKPEIGTAKADFGFSV